MSGAKLHDTYVPVTSRWKNRRGIDINGVLNDSLELASGPPKVRATSKETNEESMSQNLTPM